MHAVCVLAVKLDFFHLLALLNFVSCKIKIVRVYCYALLRVVLVRAAAAAAAASATQVDANRPPFFRGVISSCCGDEQNKLVGRGSDAFVSSLSLLDNVILVVTG